MILKDLETVSDRSMKKEQDEILNDPKQANSTPTPTTNRIGNV